MSVRSQVIALLTFDLPAGSPSHTPLSFPPTHTRRPLPLRTPRLTIMATLYIRPGPYSRLMGPDSIAPKFVILALDGQGGRLLVRSRSRSSAVHGADRFSQMLVPTGDLEDVRTLIFDHWIPMIQGPLVLSCGGTAEQRQLLLHIPLAFHAFVEGFPDVDLTDYYYMAGQLVEIALSTDADEDVEPRLVELVEWLHDALPVVCFLLYPVSAYSPVYRSSSKAPMSRPSATMTTSTPSHTRWQPAAL